MPDLYAYVRRTYGVPARVGSMVEIDGRNGRIVAANPSSLHYLNVIFDGDSFPSLCHPTWRVTYLSDGEEQAI